MSVQARHPDNQDLQKQNELESNYITIVPAMDKIAQQLYLSSPEKAVSFLTGFSVAQANNLVYEWKQLYHHLFTKFMDGNIKTRVPGQQNPKVKQPGYDEEFYRSIVKQTGDKFKVIGGSGH